MGKLKIYWLGFEAICNSNPIEVLDKMSAAKLGILEVLSSIKELE